VSEALISKGLATVLRHRQDDENRSACYGKLFAAEDDATKLKKGLHGGATTANRVADIRDKTAADRLVGSIQRSGKVSAVVESVMNGARLRLYIPKETSRCSIMLAGISAPRTAFKEKAGDAYAEESKDFMTELALQQSVEIQVEDADKNGNLIGSVFLNGTSLGEALVAEGLAKMHFTAARYGNEGSLGAAEAGAKAAKKNVWAKWDPSQDEVRESKYEKGTSTSAAKTERTKDLKEVMVTHIKDASSFYAQFTENAEKLDEVTKALTEAFASGKPESVTPKRNEICAAKFDADNQWYRAKVLRIEDGSYEIRYIDFGNEQTVKADVLAAIPEAVASLEIGPQSKFFKLALLGNVPEDYETEAAEILADGILNRNFGLNEEYSEKTDEGDTSFVTLTDEEASKPDVGETMVAMGYAIPLKRRDRHMQDLFTEYSKAQKDAASNRAGMWMYGDITDDPKM